jgi:hypothetical protein
MPYLRKGATFTYLRQGAASRRGMGQAYAGPPPGTPSVSSGACQDYVAGLTPDPGIPFCAANWAPTPVSPTAPGYEANSPGAFGPNYAAEQAAAIVASNAVSQAATPLPAPKATAATTSNPPAQSNAPNSSKAPPPASGSSSSTTQSNAPNSTAVVPVTSTPAAASCFALFGNEPCIGPIGLYTLLAGGGAVLLVMMLMGGHR